MSMFKSLCAATALALVAPVTATAATSLLESVTIDFGTDSGRESNPAVIGAATAEPDRIIVSDDNTGLDEFGAPKAVRANFNFVNNLSSLAIDRFVITLTINNVDDLPPTGINENTGLPNNGSDPIGSNWFADIRGGPGGSNAAHLRRLPTTFEQRTFSFTLDATNDGAAELGSDRPDGTANTAFQTSINQDRIRLRFIERSGDVDDFELLSATVDVYEVAAPVPVPASGLLLLGAIGGFAAWKRRKA